MDSEVKFQIERGVKVPDRNAGAPLKYPFDSMQPGDSFLIRFDGEQSRALQWARLQGNVSQCFRNWRMGAPKEREHLMLTTRAMDDGLRCWMFVKPWADRNG